MSFRNEGSVEFRDGGGGWAYSVRRHKITASFIAIAALLALAGTLLPRGDASAAATTPPAVLFPSTAYFGSRVEPRSGESQNDAVLRVESQIGRKFAIDHYYYQWDSSFPGSAQTWTVSQNRIPFINWKAGGAWSAIANGSQDATIIARADAIKSFGYPIYLTFHHEPENDLGSYGTPNEFAAAFRHIVDVFRSRNVTNVAWVWTMMGWSFDPRSGRDALAYYPGDSYIDFVGSDGYNWYPGRDGFQVELVRDDLRTVEPVRGRAREAVDGRRVRRTGRPGRSRSQGRMVRRHARHRGVLACAEGPDLLRHDEALPMGHG